MDKIEVYITEMTIYAPPLSSSSPHHAGKGMSDTITLADLGVGPNGTVQLEMQSADPVNTPLKSYRPRQEYHMPDVITVRVQTGELSYKIDAS